MKKLDKISEHITYGEAIRSDVASRAGVDNTPSDAVIEVMKVTAKKVFEPLREWVGNKIYISSFFRTPEVNILAKSKSQKSQHIRGQAIDIDMDIFGGRTNYQAFCWLRDNVEFDQLLWEGGEYGWIHISYNEGHNRKYVGQIPNP